MRKAAVLGVVAVSASAWAGLAATRRVAVVWKEGGARGEVQVARGSVVRGGPFECGAAGPCRIELEVEGPQSAYGKDATLVTIGSARNTFTFFLRDATREFPIYIPAYGVVATSGEDSRSYADIVDAIRAPGRQTMLALIDSEPEETFEAAAASTRNLKVQTWLGLGRDIRLFAVGERLDWIQPRFHGHEVTLPEAGNKPVRYNFLAGRGWGPSDEITRRLEDGALPILHGRVVDDTITYDVTAFVGLESSPVSAGTVRGTHFLVADGFGHGHMFTPEQQKMHDALLEAELNRPEETVLYLRVTAVNTTQAPAYAFFRNVWPSGIAEREWTFDGTRGFSAYKPGRVFAVAKLNGTPLAAEEVAILLRPAEAATLEIFLPHRPIPEERAAKLAGQNFETRHAELREFWTEKLGRAARVRLPEKRIEEMMRAGLLHLDLITYGLEPNDTLTATIGVYSAIGSESSPIIQYMDSMGRHDVARRALMYFLDKQHDDGFIQNFGGYMLETGAALWSLGEHYRYTRDDEWARAVAPKVLKACRYLKQWRERNLREELRGRGFGMLEGKAADPEDPFRSFMLNGYAYLGLSRAAEMLRAADPGESKRWAAVAEELKSDIRSTVAAVMGRSPVVPLRDGTWAPTLPPWAEYRGPLALHADAGTWFTHGAITARDSLLGPLYLVFQEVLDPREDAATFLLEFHNELMTKRNVAFSQPYYSRHPIVHLRRGEVKRFLKAYYNMAASLADRETYTFWEHFFGASPHKTHEEGWFLMDSRWMLYMEQGDTLKLLSGAPRKYFKSGNRVELNRVASYFGPLSLTVESDLERTGRIEVAVECQTERKPRVVEIRLPHPDGKKARRVEGGVYEQETESVRVEGFNGKARVVAVF
jgi:hypothetical protein